MKAKLVLALAFALALATAPARAEPPEPVTITQSVVTLSAATDAALNVGPHDRSLCLMNIGTNDATINFNGTAAVAGQGWALAAAAGAGKAGGYKCWDDGTVPQGIVHGISTGGTSIVVLEGR